MNILVQRFVILDYQQFEYADSFSSQPSAHGTVSWSAPELLLGRECTTKSMYIPLHLLCGSYWPEQFHIDVNQMQK